MIIAITIAGLTITVAAAGDLSGADKIKQTSNFKTPRGVFLFGARVKQAAYLL
jgi:hypothetical protein